MASCEYCQALGSTSSGFIPGDVIGDLRQVEIVLPTAIAARRPHEGTANVLHAMMSLLMAQANAVHLFCAIYNVPHPGCCGIVSLIFREPISHQADFTCKLGSCL